MAEVADLDAAGAERVAQRGQAARRAAVEERQAVVGLDEVRGDATRIAAVEEVERLVDAHARDAISGYPYRDGATGGSSVEGVGDDFRAARQSLLRPHTDKEAPMPAPTLVVGAPCWIDLYSSDTDEGDRVLRPAVRLDGGAAAGGLRRLLHRSRRTASTSPAAWRNDGEAGYPDAWGVHLMTDDVEATAECGAGARRHGRDGADGRRRERPLDDDQGSRRRRSIGAWQPETQKGFEVTGEPGTPAWFELHTRAYDAVRRLLPRRVRVGRAHGERHPRVPLHDPRRGREPARGDHGRRRSEATTRRLDRLLRRDRRRRRARAGRGARRDDRSAGGGHAVRPARAAADPTGTRFRLVASNG